jgi:hypothetical protein
MSDPDPSPPPYPTGQSHAPVGTWLTLGVLGVLLAFALIIMYVGWGMGDDDPAHAMTTTGYVAMGFGIMATLALGVGLMALVFWSNRTGRD